jgi:8-oxo-dGTP pyrophosphatase MutT (NUDIX family)
MRAAIREKRESRLTIGWTQVRKVQSSAKFVRLAELRKLRECEQVAAVCYRMRGSEIEFLLVKTGKGRWIFPKGSVEPGLTHAQAAALEAFEEAGVHGRMEEASFARYIRRRRREARNAASRSTEKESAVNAHLCEVLRLVPPQELGRNPSWFSPEKAKRRLQEHRAPDFGNELARVVDRAVSRIRQSRGQNATASRALQPGVRSLESSGLPKVQFIDIGRVWEAAGKTKPPRIG